MREVLGARQNRDGPTRVKWLLGETAVIPPGHRRLWRVAVAHRWRTRPELRARLAGAVARQFLYGSGATPFAELDTFGAIRSQFVSVTGGVAPDYMERGGVTYYLAQDQLGSVRQVIDVSTGAVVQALDYDVDGVVIRNTNPGFQPFGYAGGLMDLDGGTVHFGARDYDARTARWLQPDPIGARAQNVSCTDAGGVGSCAVKRENRIRREANIPRRKY